MNAAILILSAAAALGVGQESGPVTAIPQVANGETIILLPGDTADVGGKRGGWFASKWLRRTQTENGPAESDPAYEAAAQQQRESRRATLQFIFHPILWQMRPTPPIDGGRMEMGH